MTASRALDPFILIHGNVEAPDKAPLTAGTVRAIAARADVATFNEVQEASTAAVLRALDGFGVYIGAGSARENAIIWRESQFELVAAGEQVVMIGGHVGQDGRKGGDDRRVGPNRSVVWVVLRQRSTGLLVIVATHHAVAKGDTSQKWRRLIRSRGFAGVRVEMLAVRRAYPGAPILLTGDLNTIGRVVFGYGEREVATPATFGRLRYDRLFALGAALVSKVFTFRTNSDHKAIGCTVLLNGTPVEGVAVANPPVSAPARPKPTPKPKQKLTRAQRARLAYLNRKFRRHPKRMTARQRRIRLRLIRLRNS